MFVFVFVVVVAFVSRLASILLVLCLTADAGRVAVVMLGVVLVGVVAGAVVMVVFAADVIVLRMRLLRSAWNTMRPPLLRQRSSRLNT